MLSLICFSVSLSKFLSLFRNSLYCPNELYVIVLIRNSKAVFYISLQYTYFIKSRFDIDGTACLHSEVNKTSEKTLPRIVLFCYWSAVVTLKLNILDTWIERESERGREREREIERERTEESQIKKKMRGEGGGGG